MQGEFREYMPCHMGHRSIFDNSILSRTMLEKFSVVEYSIYVGKNQNKIPKITKLNTTLVFSV